MLVEIKKLKDLAEKINEGINFVNSNMVSFAAEIVELRNQNAQMKRLLKFVNEVDHEDFLNRISSEWDEIDNLVFENESEIIENKISKEETKKKEILEICFHDIEFMWAAKIAGILLECDFRDSKQEIEKFLGKTIKSKGFYGR